MTVYVHKNNGTVGYGTHHHEAPAKIEGRTWSFTCKDPGCEERILRDVEHSARSEGSVPLSEEEKAEEEMLSQTAKKDVTQMAMALSELAKQGAKASA
jgi:hypothetical protein